VRFQIKVHSALVVRLKYYDAEKMREIWDELEKEILNWPGVSSREMIGAEWLVKIEQENGFQDERENFQEAGVGAENPLEPAERFYLF